MFLNTSISLDEICSNQDEIDSNFDCFHTGYRAIIRLFDLNVIYQSKKLFDSYDEAWSFVRVESKCFKSCEMYVIKSVQFPTLDLSFTEVPEFLKKDDSSLRSSFNLNKIRSDNATK